jgi:hypothetical protein
MLMGVRILEKAREQLDVLAALRNATELYSDQKRKRKDAPTDAQPPKTKKARTYVPLLYVKPTELETKSELAHR